MCIVNLLCILKIVDLNKRIVKGFIKIKEYIEKLKKDIKEQNINI